MSTSVTLITGGSGGLGQALCHSLCGVGPIGIHVHSNIERGEESLRLLKAAGTESTLFTADLRDSKSVKKMFDDLLMKWQRLDLLINSAGVIDDHLYATLNEAAWDHVLDINLTGVFYCLREAGRIMKTQGGGHIVNVASQSAFTGRIGQAAYTASKRGLIALTHSAAREWGAYGIQVNAVLPGLLETRMSASLTPAQKEKIVNENLLKRPSTLPEVSGFIRHLAQMKHVSGQIFNLDSRIY